MRKAHRTTGRGRSRRGPSTVATALAMGLDLRMAMGLALVGALLSSDFASAKQTERLPSSVAAANVEQADKQEASFSDATAKLGVDFQHRHFGTGEKYMPENMGAGVAVFDANGDGHLDLYFVQGAPWHNKEETPTAERTNRLYLWSNGKFEAAQDSGLEDEGYGMGVALGDVDGDGLLDVFVTNFGENRLYRNRGDGRFVDETAARLRPAAQNDASLWSTGAAFFDADHDGDLDLYVANYVDFSIQNHKFCGSAARRIRSYCHPDIYNAQPDIFYKNRGDGIFEEASSWMGLHSPALLKESKGLGVVAADLNEDGASDLLVANDSTRNFAFFSQPGHSKADPSKSDQTIGWSLQEDGLLSGLGYSGSGEAEASMGVALGDVDADGRIDLFLTHLDQETNTLYRNLGGGLFEDQTKKRQLDIPSLPWVGFGTVLFDMDLDGDLDLFVGNGHIIDNIELFDPDRSYLQPAQLFENRGGGHFVEVTSALGLGERKLAVRGAIAADWDQDGDLDLVLTQNNGPAVLLENTLQTERSIVVQLAPADSPPNGFGARVDLLLVEKDSSTKLLASRWMQGSESYLSQGPPVVLHALPSELASELAQTLALKVSWPSGAVSTIPIVPETNRSLQLIVSEPPSETTEEPEVPSEKNLQ